MIIPHYSSTTLTGRRVLVDNLIDPRISTVTLDSGNTDANGTPTHRIRPGNVVVRRASTGRYVEANDTNGDRAVAPTKSTTSHTDGNGVIKLVGNHGTISVTTTTGTGTEANNATDLNADADFAAHYTASSAGGELTITANRGGKSEWFYIHTDTMSTAPFTEGEDNGVAGEDADFRVVLDFVDLKDEEGTACHGDAKVAWTGHFDASNLINLTPEARATLAARGAKFDDE